MSENWHQVQLTTQADWRNASATRLKTMATENGTEGADLFRSQAQQITALALLHYMATLSTCLTILNYWNSLMPPADPPRGSGGHVA